MTGWKAVLPVLLAMAPLTVRAQSAIYTGRLSCTPTDGGTVPGGTDPITINSRSYQGTYTHRMDSAGGALAGLQDFGRGSLVGRDLTLHGGASRMGVKLETTIKASNSGRTYDLQATQRFSGRGFAVPQTRTCKGTARLFIG